MYLTASNQFLYKVELETGPETPILHKRPFLWHRLSIP